MNTSFVTLPDPVDFDDNDLLIRYLGNRLQYGRLALFLCAGVSTPLGLPDWDALILKMYQNKKGRCTNKKTPQFRAEAFLREYYPDDYDGYLISIKQALYGKKNYQLQDIRKNRTIAAIASL